MQQNLTRQQNFKLNLIKKGGWPALVLSGSSGLVHFESDFSKTLFKSLCCINLVKP